MSGVYVYEMICSGCGARKSLRGMIEPGGNGDVIAAFQLAGVLVEGDPVPRCSVCRGIPVLSVREGI